MVFGWGDFYDIGKNGGDVADETALMSVRGIILMLLPALPFIIKDYILFAAMLSAGVLMGPVYYLARHTSYGSWRVPKVVKNPTQAAEILFGFIIGLLIMAGKKIPQIWGI